MLDLLLGLAGRITMCLRIRQPKDRLDSLQNFGNGTMGRRTWRGGLRSAQNALQCQYNTVTVRRRSRGRNRTARSWRAAKGYSERVHGIPEIRVAMNEIRIRANEEGICLIRF